MTPAADPPTTTPPDSASPRTAGADTAGTESDTDTDTDTTASLAVMFPFVFDGRFAPLDRLLGIRPGTAFVEVADDVLRVVFGRWEVVTSLTNVADAEVTGPYFWPKVIGPPRLSVRDRGLTFATNDRRGVCVRFREPVPGALPVPWLRHPAVTLTVDDADRLAEVLREAGRRSEAGRSLDHVAVELEDGIHGATAAELRERARALGIARTSRMTKAELVDALDAAARAEAPGGDAVES
jgi:hypothetical protein